VTQHLHAVAIVVPDYDQALGFYCDQLGFDLIQDLPMGPDKEGIEKRWVLIAPPGGQTNILLARASDDAQRQAIGSQTGGRVGFFLHSDDFDRDFAAMTGAGVRFEESPRAEPYGKVAVFRDPFGNRWDLLMLAETSEQGQG
jgi:catechol 2,3-dioxygenase-like lactoylglutathione lyase family enzyme